MKVRIKKLHENAVIPSYAKVGDAGMDLTAISTDTSPVDFSSSKGEGYFYIEYGTGLAMEIPEGFVGLIFPRSSVSKTALILANAVGVVDSGYRGEIKCRFKSTDLRQGVHYKVGEKIAQIIIFPVPYVDFIESEELSDTERGEGGFGHTGK